MILHTRHHHLASLKSPQPTTCCLRSLTHAAPQALPPPFLSWTVGTRLNPPHFSPSRQNCVHLAIPFVDSYYRQSGNNDFSRAVLLMFSSSGTAQLSRPKKISYPVEPSGTTSAVTATRAVVVSTLPLARPRLPFHNLIFNRTLILVCAQGVP